MAIDYKKEWGNLRNSTGHCTVIKNETGTTLANIMDTQIVSTIENREKLMQEYVREQIETDIVGADTLCHKVKLEVITEPRGCIWISKSAFDAWCKKKGGK